MLKEAFMASAKTKVAALLMKDKLKDLKSKMDYTEYGGAALFGLKAPVIKAHGSSNAQAFASAIRQARQMVEYNVSKTIDETITTND